MATLSIFRQDEARTNPEGYWPQGWGVAVQSVYVSGDKVAGPHGAFRAGAEPVSGATKPRPLVGGLETKAEAERELAEIERAYRDSKAARTNPRRRGIPPVRTFSVRWEGGPRLLIDTISKRMAALIVRMDHPESWGHNLIVSVYRAPRGKRGNPGRDFVLPSETAWELSVAFSPASGRYVAKAVTDTGQLREFLGETAEEAAANAVRAMGRSHLTTKNPDDPLFPGMGTSRYKNLKQGEEFRFPGDPKVYTKLSGGWYTDGFGGKWRTGSMTGVERVARGNPRAGYRYQFPEARDGTLLLTEAEVESKRRHGYVDGKMVVVMDTDTGATTARPFRIATLAEQRQCPRCVGSESDLALLCDDCRSVMKQHAVEGPYGTRRRMDAARFLGIDDERRARLERLPEAFRNPAKKRRITPAVLKQDPILRMKVDRFHVGTPVEEVIEEIRAELVPGAWEKMTRAQQGAFEIAVKELHQDNRDLYRRVMGGMK
jgi:hypothetical protein